MYLPELGLGQIIDKQVMSVKALTEIMIYYYYTSSCEVRGSERMSYNIIEHEFPSLYLGNYEISEGGPVICNNVHIWYPIEWLILERDNQNKRILLLSKYIVDTMEFAEYPSTRGFNTVWSNSGIRKWLNNDFLSIAFSPEEKVMICPTHILPANVNDTPDYLFLLSEAEFTKYFENKSSVAYIYYAFCHDNKGYSLACEKWSWWLRSKGALRDETKYIEKNGGLYLQNSFQNGETGVRPAMWVRY